MIYFTLNQIIDSFEVYLSSNPQALKASIGIAMAVACMGGIIYFYNNRRK